MRLFIFFYVVFSIAACAKAKDPIELVPPTPDDRVSYHAASEHLLNGHVYGGFGVVSLKPDGSPEHLGEALIWGGTALWVLGCDEGAALSAALARMVLDHEGAMIRVDPLGEYDDGRQVTLDGVLGAFLGIARRVMDCGEKELWRAPLSAMTAFQQANDDRLHPDTPAKGMFAEFKYLRDLARWKAGGGGEPADNRQGDLEKMVGGWAFAVQVARKACYPVNLGLTSLLTIETLGESVSGAGRDQFCANTTGMDIPSVDHYCGRKPISDYLDDYQVDEYEYRFQRCGTWESPDGDGNTSPQLDRLVGLVLKHGWSALQKDETISL